jgi:hypothetical protein
VTPKLTITNQDGVWVEGYLFFGDDGTVMFHDDELDDESPLTTVAREALIADGVPTT